MTEWNVFYELRSFGALQLVLMSFGLSMYIWMLIFTPKEFPKFALVLMSISMVLFTFLYFSLNSRINLKENMNNGIGVDSYEGRFIINSDESCISKNSRNQSGCLYTSYDGYVGDTFIALFPAVGRIAANLCYEADIRPLKKIDGKHVRFVGIWESVSEIDKSWLHEKYQKVFCIYKIEVLDNNKTENI
ncbi:hypothetical protein OE749_11595 [Aestuariibacter sp. AA17]|uniref:Uncharacterized protein n=1 Tax=Fluctibacter corallii TaxID=2984329 RepID=A0ABT3AAL9_9ALTE|nr:hypothetical protein [Aestuariibacter sp. AA17]MCV2885337.1 hypothetical protein [Aestuariibacter sp. AA17]